ncbi:DUF6807 family protein [Aureibaculum luteum]|uniref:DUF6807 family protein n=1 Tax=Aureibaculum luteum TaxID=1548456 RepID=UPI000E52B93B|nr:DUF6807 family protein [Aureibaculum luteum]
MRYFISIFLFLCLENIAQSQSVSVQIQDNVVLFKEGKDSVLCYQIANKELDGKHKRSNYIHPLYTLDGKILTEDFPSDHPHHRGIFWAWHQLHIGDKQIGDGWEIKDFKWKVLSVKELKKKGKQRSIKANVVWKSPLWLDDNGNEKPLVSEYTTITVYPKAKNYRQIDIEISLIAEEPNMRIGGSDDKKGYGGFSTRIRLSEDIAFTSSIGSIKQEQLPIKAGGWMDISGSLGLKNAMAGISILSHPNNPGYPNPWILRSKESMQNAVYPYPGAKPVILSNVAPTLLRYRLLVHNGLKASEISSLHTHYGKM